MINKNKHWLMYKSPLIYHFLIMDELITFPMTYDVKYFLNNMNLKGNTLNHKWFNLLKRVFGSNINYDSLYSLKNIIIESRIKINKRNNLTCSLCLDKINKDSAIHICKNGHINHLKCIMEFEKNYCISILNNINFNKNIDNFIKNGRKCGICRCNNLNILDDNLKLIVENAN